MAAISKSKADIRKLNKLYMDLEMQLAEDDVKTMKMLLSNNQITKRDEKTLKSATAVFHYLEERGFIAENNLKLLENIFETMYRPLLSELVKKFCGDRRKEKEKKTDDGTSQQGDPVDETAGGTGKKGGAEAHSSSNEESNNPSGSSALLICNKWNNGLDRVAIVNQSLATQLAQKVTTYSTILDVKDNNITEDKETGVRLVSPDKEVVNRLPNRAPNIEWLLVSHASYFSHLKTGIPGISIVLGHFAVDGDSQHLANAGLNIKNEVAGDSQFILFNHEVGEDFGNIDVENSACEIASRASATFSVGPYVYDHYSIKYQALKSVDHLCYYPDLNRQFLKIELQPNTGNQKQILTICNVKSRNDFGRYDLVAMAMGKVGEKFHGVHETVPVWKLYGVKEGIGNDFRKYLIDKSQCGYLNIPAPYTDVSPATLKIAIQQSVLLLAPEKKDPFNFPAYLAMQAGLPTLVPSCSGINVFLDRLFPRDGYSDYCSVNTGFYDNTAETDSKKWCDKIISIINTKTCGVAFKRADEIKKKLVDNSTILESQKEFLQKCQEVLDSQNGEAEGRQRTISSDSALSLASIDESPDDVLDGMKSPEKVSTQRSTKWTGQLTALRAEKDDYETLKVYKIGKAQKYQIGEGQNDTKVYLGINEQNQSPIAVKIIKTNEVESNQREIEPEMSKKSSIKQSNHIVQQHDVIKHGEHLYIVMELCERTLDDHMKQNKDMPLKEKEELILDMLTGLKCLHEDAKIVHRDLKPQNILIGFDGKAKLSDFGISRQLDITKTQKTFKTDAAGTQFWLSTEAMNCEQGKSDCSLKGDIQVAGMLMYYILSDGRHPYGKQGTIKESVETQQNMINGKYNLSDLNCVLAKHLISLMLSTERGKRPSISEVLGHPYFWEFSECLSYLVKLATEAESDTSKLHRLHEKESDKKWLEAASKGPFSCEIQEKCSGTLMEFIQFANTCSDSFGKGIDAAEYIMTEFPNMFIGIYDAIEGPSSKTKA